MNDNLKKFYNDNFSSDASLSVEAKQRVKNNILSNLHAAPTVVPISFWDKLRAVIPKTYVIIPAVLILFVAGTGIVSAGALPGDKLYAVKRQIENARILVTPTEEAKLELQVEYAEKRLKELEKVTEREKVQTKPAVNTKDLNKPDDNNSNTRLQNERRLRAKQEAEDAVKFLRKTREDWQKKGEENKVREINRRLENFRIQNDNSNRDNNEDRDRERSDDRRSNNNSENSGSDRWDRNMD